MTKEQPSNSPTRDRVAMTLLRSLPWEWIYRASLLAVVGSIMLWADNHYDARYDARFVKLADYNRDIANTAAIATVTANSDHREMAMVQKNLDEIKSDVKQLLSNRKP